MSMQRSGADTGVSPTSAALSVTRERLLRLAPQGRAAIVAGLAASFDRSAAAAGITTRLRLCHVLAQAAHESDGFRTLEEYGGPAYFARYDGRRDLGNTQAGDGARYHGRGLFQLTGRANYRRYGSLIGIDLEGSPERAKEPAVSLAIAFAYWRDRGCNAAADADDVVAVTKLVNGGRNGLAQRRQLLALAKTIWV
ncbi:MULTISPECIES: glycoside hydrolase family 19 protein [Hyphomicrobiales]|jgi:putative chitinase|uniref:Glycoside hydrolase family 19 protein n=1 Tax=Bosea massiliensis TaxID=151419 RepID=A0ABW0P8I1_9HYPH|nr:MULTISPECIES: glycoside hydrolase family 19 protein [Hyphomicrobiales]